MIFVNEIAEVVHRVVDNYSGAPNKNIGDAFLLVWKFEDEDTILDPYTGEMMVDKENPRVSSLTELAVFSFLKLPVALSRANKLAKYRKNPGLLERLKTSTFNVKMGFGMHVGWAIEGAIGSKYKIDASYLSPHVNIASRLEAATKQYGVSLLISEKVKELVREPLKGMMRALDNVMIKGSAQSLQICTVDYAIPDSFYVTQYTAEDKSGIEKKRDRIKLKKERNLLRSQIESAELDIRSLLLGDDDIIQMRIHYTNEFHREWNTAINNYFRGDWLKAKEGLNKTLNMAKRNALTKVEQIPEDGPSRTILNFMAKTNYEKPQDWIGVRDLTEN